MQLADQFGWQSILAAVIAETQSLETRALGMSLALAIDNLMSWVARSAGLTMLCKLQWGTYLLLSGTAVIATVSGPAVGAWWQLVGVGGSWWRLVVERGDWPHLIVSNAMERTAW